MKKNSEFIEGVGGIDVVQKVQKGEKSFKQVIGFTPKEKHWWSSRENKVLAAAKETYDKNVNKINRLRNENNKLESKLDPFLGGGKGAVLAAINEKGIHLSSTREKTVELFDKMRADCIRDYFGLNKNNDGNLKRPTPEQEEEFKKKVPEERAFIFQKYFDDHIDEDRYNTFDNSTKNLLKGVLVETISKPLEQIEINNTAIDATLEKNIDILKQAEPIVEKKKSKLEYKKAKIEKPKVVEENSLGNIVANDETRDEKKKILQEKREELEQKRKILKETEFNEIDILDRSKIFRKNIGNNVKVFNFDYQKGKEQMMKSSYSV